MKIKLFALDVDGVMTDGTLYYTGDGEEMKAFNAQDGLGLKLLGKLGIRVAVLSGRGGAALERRLDDLGILNRRLKCANKVQALEDICADLGLKFAEVAFMGDDLIDLGAMEASGYAIAPANAVDAVKAAANHTTTREGGKGAVREACDHLAGLEGVTLESIARGVTKVLVQ